MNPQIIGSSAPLADWLQTPAGLYLAEWESAQFDQAVADVFGYHGLQLGQPDLALQVYLGLTQEYPELPEPHNNLGVMYALKGDYAKAKASLDAALRANPNYAAALENLGDVLVNLARQAYERSLSLDAKQPNLRPKIERLRPILDMTQGKP